MANLVQNATPLARELLDAMAEAGARANGESHATNGDSRLESNGDGNGNGVRNGNGARNGNGHRNGNANGTGNGNLAGRISKPEARRIATKVGRDILAAQSVATARHSDDVVVIVRAICDLLEIRGSEREDLLAAARLHDIGKAAVPIEILNKPGPLDEAEWELVRTHTVVGERILASVPELGGIARLVRHSHERWDGGGYPDGLAGEAIPLGSRIIFCADAFHAIRSDRPYQARSLPATALVELRRNAGTQFDPAVVTALDHVVRELRMAPANGRVRRSSRLSALLLMLVIGGAGSAIAKSDLLGTIGPADASGANAPALTTTCSPLYCPALLGTSFADHVRRWKQVHGAPSPDSTVGSSLDRPRKKRGPSEAGIPGPIDSGAGEAPAFAPDRVSPTLRGGGGGAAKAPDTEPDTGGGSTPPKSNGSHPHGGPPGQTGNHPLGGPPGQTGNHPQGGPPGQTGNHPEGNPTGQSK